jgi:hypothetical protein
VGGTDALVDASTAGAERAAIVELSPVRAIAFAGELIAAGLPKLR